MKWFFAMLIGSLSGWLIASVTDDVAIAASSGAAIGVLATIALIGTRPVHSMAKVAGAMAIGCLAGWLVDTVTTHQPFAMVMGASIGVLATIAVASTRPARSLAKLIAAMTFGFSAGWLIGMAIGDHNIGMALAIPLGLPLLLLLAGKEPQLRRRPF